MKLTEYQKQIFNHVGEIVSVYDNSYNKIWNHPNAAHLIKDGRHALRVWVSLDKDKGPYGGDYTFILLSDGDAPEGVYDKAANVNPQAVEDIISCIMVSICEDVTVWGQDAFEEPYLSIVDKIAGAAYRGEGKVFVHFSPDCAVYVENNEVGYDT